MTRRCIALISGGLDSTLAIRLMQEQGIEVEAVNFKTVFTCCQDTSAQVARQLGIQLTVIGQEEDYLDLVKKPQFGYGKGANPCVDCRIYMFDKAKDYMEKVNADFIVSGEVVGQRPMSQKKADLAVISHHSGLDDLLLRPLSAKLLPPTLPEREGWVDRSKLYDFYGRGRKGLIRLANELGVTEIPSPSTGCSLTEPRFSRKVFDLIRIEPHKGLWDYDLLKIGRHFRLNAQTKIVVGRQATDNDHLEFAHEQTTASSEAMLKPKNFPGPVALIIGPLNDDSLRFASGLILRYANHRETDSPQLELHQSGKPVEHVVAETCAEAEQAKTLAS